MLHATYVRLNRYEIGFHILIGFAKLNFSLSHCNVAIKARYRKFFHKEVFKIAECYSSPSARIAVTILIRVCRFFYFDLKKKSIDFPTFELADVTYVDARFRVGVGNYFLLSRFRVRLRNDRNFSRRWIFIIRQGNFIKERKRQGVIRVLVIVIFNWRISRHFLEKNKNKSANYLSLTNYIIR